MEKKRELYRGKAKSVYETDDPNHYIMLFRDDTSAFNGKKIEQLDRKGRTNNHFNFFIMKKLEEAGIPVHVEELLSDTECLVKKLEMVPVECVVRNVSAGSICKRYGVKEGLDLNPPTFEFFLKSDALDDPMVNDSHIVSFGWGTQEDIDTMRNLSYKINEVLKDLFEMVKRIVGFKGEILYDKTKPNGTPRKMMDATRIKALGWKPKISLEQGIAEFYRWYCQ